MISAELNNNLINTIPRHWTSANLEDAVDILDSQRVPVNAKERMNRQGSVPYYGATGQVGWIDDYLFDEELILLGEDGAPFLDATKQKAYIIRGKSWVNNHAHVLRARDGIPSSYIKYYLDIVDYHGFVTGTTRYKLNQAAMRRIPVPVAPTEEQNSIVAEIEKQFSRLDETVAAMKRIKANLKRYKASVIKAAVEGKLTEEWRKEHPDVEPASELLKRILAEHRRKWEEAELEKMRAKGKEPKDDKWKTKYKEPFKPNAVNIELPQKWTLATIQQLAELVQYGSSSKTNEDLTGIPVLRMGNIFEGALIFNKLKYLPKDHDEFPDLLLNHNDLLFNRTNSPELVGKTAVYKNKPRPCSFASYLIRVTFNNDIDPDFNSYYLNSTYGRMWIKSVVSQQVGQANVNGTKLQAVTVPLPPFEEQVEIALIVENKFSVFSELEREIDNTVKRTELLRQSILKRAFSGKLVPQAACEESAI